MSEVKVDERSTTRDERGQVLLDLSNAVVRIHKQYYGKGPTKARSHLTHDLLTVILEGGYTRSEQTLLEHGHEAEVTLARAALQDSVESELRVAVEQILGRSVRSFMSANDPAGDLQAEIFVLASTPPARYDPESDLSERARRGGGPPRGVPQGHPPPPAAQGQ